MNVGNEKMGITEQNSALEEDLIELEQGPDLD